MRMQQVVAGVGMFLGTAACAVAEFSKRRAMVRFVMGIFLLL